MVSSYEWAAHRQRKQSRVKQFKEEGIIKKGRGPKVVRLRSVLRVRSRCLLHSCGPPARGIELGLRIGPEASGICLTDYNLWLTISAISELIKPAARETSCRPRFFKIPRNNNK